LVEGNHLFVSTSGENEPGRAPSGQRAVTVSTHVPLRALRKAEREGKAAEYVEQVQMTMKRTLAALAPEWWDGRKRVYTASPRTFARFTGRPRGAVGGVPRTAGLGAYFGSGPYEPMDGVFLVGDSVFPGQSALATAVGGARTAVTVGKRLGARRIA
jgi:phytoene dehydrogenase-like protein